MFWNKKTEFCERYFWIMIEMRGSTMKNKDNDKKISFKNLFRTLFFAGQLLFFAALPIVAFGLSGYKAEQSRDGIPQEPVVTVNAEPLNAKLPELALSARGVVNTGVNVPLYNVQGQDTGEPAEQKAVYNETEFLSSEYVGERYAYALAELANEDTRVADILANEEDYPVQLLEMLANYPETVDFVSAYPYEKDEAPADTVGEVKSGEIPLLIQWDKRWGYAEYGDCIIANTGCGPTCLSMVIVGLTGDVTVTPKVVSDYASEHNYYQSGAGTKWTLMSEGAEYFGVRGTELGLSRTQVFDCLEAGMPIICSVGRGDFTTNGHFIVLVGIEDGCIRVNDPNSWANSGKLWTYEELEPQIVNLWAYERQ